MRRSAGTVLLVFFLLFTLTSCASSGDVCYYGYFSDAAVVVVYSASRNTLYEIDIPLEQIALWGRATGLENVSAAMRSYVGLREDGFMLGNSQVLAAVRDILDALSGSDEPSRISRLDVLVSRPEIVSNRRLLENMNRLCGTDFTPLAKALKGKNADARFFDAGTFLDTQDIVYSQDYFTRWLSQVLGTEKI